MFSMLVEWHITRRAYDFGQEERDADAQYDSNTGRILHGCSRFVQEGIIG